MRTTGSAFIISFCMVINVLASTNPGLIQNAYNRENKSLNGEWHSIIDQYGSGYYHNMSHQPFHEIDEKPWLFYQGLFHDKMPEGKSDLVEYDFDRSPTLLVPGDWNSQRDELRYFDGSIWYKKTFHFLPGGKRHFLYFGAANHEANVFLNGQFVGTHVGGFTPFNFEVTNKLKEGNNSLIVRVDNRKGKETVPAIFKDWWNYGGLTRDVLLVSVPKTFIRDYLVQLNGNSSEIMVKVHIDMTNSQNHVLLEIPELGIHEKIAIDNNGNGQAIIQAKGVKLWEPANPKLYDVILTAGHDRVEDKIGFRTIETKGHQILLNGNPIFLKGISIHEEIPTRKSRAYLKEDALYHLNFVKELNGNYARLAHYPHNEHIVRLADEMGILLWTEIPVYHGIAYHNEATYQNAEDQLSEMINRDKNRASIIIWSVANETPVSNPNRLPFLKRLINHARALDEQRLVSAAVHIDFSVEDVNLKKVNDPLTEFLDVISVNEYIGWYGSGLPNTCRQKKWEIRYEKPFLVSETGAGALAGFHADSLTRWSEEYQEWYYKEQVAMLAKIPELCGMTPWILMDFMSPNRRHPVYQGLFNRKGLISNNGQKKKAFYVLQQFYKDYEKYYE